MQKRNDCVKVRGTETLQGALGTVAFWRLVQLFYTYKCACVPYMPGREETELSTQATDSKPLLKKVLQI